MKNEKSNITVQLDKLWKEGWLRIHYFVHRYV